MRELWKKWGGGEILNLVILLDYLSCHNSS
jgi:hypothetical protein